MQFVPESTRYLVAAGRTAEAGEILKRGARMNRSSLPEGRLVDSNVKVGVARPCLHTLSVQLMMMMMMMMMMMILLLQLLLLIIITITMIMIMIIIIIMSRHFSRPLSGEPGELTIQIKDTNACTHTLTYMHARTHARTHAHTHAHTHTRTHTRTHT